MDKNKALEIWEEFFGDRAVAYDFASHPMKKEDFQNKDSHYGWDIDEKKPYLNRPDNYLPCSINTINFRQKKSSFKVGNNIFEVRKGKVYGTFSIYDITDRNNPINTDPTEENQDPSYNRERFHNIAVSRNNGNRNGFKILNPKSIMDNVLNQRLEENDVTVDDYSFLFDDGEEKVTEETVSSVEESLAQEPVSDSVETVNEEEKIAEEAPAIQEETSTEEASDVEEAPVTEEVIPDTEEKTAADEPVVEEENIQHGLIEDESLEEEEIQNEEVHDEYQGESYLETIERLEKKVAEEESVIASLNAEKMILKSQYDKLEKDNQDILRLKDDAISEKENQNLQIQEILSANEALKNRINELTIQNENSLADAKKEKEQLETELSQAKEANISLSMQMNEVQSRSDSSSTFIEEMKEQNKNLETELTSLHEETESLKAEIEELKNHHAEEMKEKEEEKMNLTSLLEEEKKKNGDFLIEMNLLRQTKAEEEEAKENTISSVENEKAELIKEKEELLHEISSYKENEIQLKTELEELKKKDDMLQQDYNQLDAQSSLASDQLESLDDENKNLTKKLEEKDFAYDELNKKYSNLLLENESLAQSNKDKDESLLKAESEKSVNDEANQRNVAKIDALNEKITSLENEYDSYKSQNSQENAGLKDEVERLSNEITSLQKEVDDDTRTILYLSLGGKKDCYDEFVSYLGENGLDFNEENILSSFIQHPTWKNEFASELDEFHGNSTLVDESLVSYPALDNERKEKAMNFYDQIFSLEKNEVSDFAGRFIRVSDYGKENSDYGWDYCLYDKSGKEEKDNIFIANLKTIKDYHYDTPFESNSHTFEIVKENGKPKIVSSDFISDPYDFSQAIRVTRNNQNKKSPLIYLFIKISGINTAEPDRDALMEFFDLMDCSAKRSCPESFLEMKTLGYGKGNYALITFDGNVKNSYKEVLDYAVLLNSYRREYWQQKKLNAIIVLNELEVPFSKRHLDYDALLNETKDDELRALRYEFNMTVINSIIKRTIHIGPRILDKLPLDQNLLKPSQIGQGNFAQMYRFNKEFKVYNFVFSLTHKEEETQD
jgi:hypothetical protein